MSETSHETLAELGHEVGDNGAGERELYASLVRRNLMFRLTPIQRRVVICFDVYGLSRKETAQRLMVSVQEIHQIVSRIKERFPELDDRVIRTITGFYWLVYPGTDARSAYAHWNSHPWLMEYRRPDLKTLEAWYRRYLAGKEEHGRSKTASN